MPIYEYAFVLMIIFLCIQLAFDYWIDYHLRRRLHYTDQMQFFLYEQRLRNYRFEGSVINIKRVINFDRTKTILYLLFGFITGLIVMNEVELHSLIINILSCLLLLLEVLISLNREIDMVAERNYFATYLIHHPANNLHVVLKSKRLLNIKLAITMITIIIGLILLSIAIFIK